MNKVIPNQNRLLEDLYYHPHKLGWLLGYDKLTELHSEWIKYLFDSPGGTIPVLQAHRGSYKTTALVVGLIRDLIFHPNRTHAVIRKSYTDAQKILNEVQAHFGKEELNKVFALFGVDDPKGDTWTKDAFNISTRKKISKERNIECYGIDTAITGSHHDIIHLDDIVTLDDRISKVKRQATIERYYEYVNIVLTKKHGIISVSGTPWHRKDAFSVMPDPLKYSIHNINPKILTETQIAAIKKIQPPSLFAANYELQHINTEGALFTNPTYGDFQILLPGAIAHLDAAYDGDHTCALTIMTKRPDGFYQAKGWVYPGNVKDWLPFIVKTCKQYRVKMLHNESNPDKGYTADKLRQMGLAVHSYAELQNKDIKIATQLYHVWSRIIWDTNIDPEYMTQILDWMEGQEPDDAPDSAASLIRESYGVVERGNDALWKW